jgi:hypothetical protein
MPSFPAGARTRVMLESFAYGDVSLKPGLFKERFDLNRRYLAALDNARCSTRSASRHFCPIRERVLA